MPLNDIATRELHESVPTSDDDYAHVDDGCIMRYQTKCSFRNCSVKNFKTANFESLMRAQKLVFSHEFFTKALSLSKLYVC